MPLVAELTAPMPEIVASATWALRQSCLMDAIISSPLSILRTI
jgi:hypothetical protein